MNPSIRLDQAVAHHYSLSRSEAKKAIIAGQILVNGTLILKPSHWVGDTDSLEWISLNTPSIEIPQLDRHLLYEDGHILLLNKPKGVVIHPGAGVKEGTVCDWLVQHYPDIKHVGQSDRPGIVHRIDKETAGVLVIAKSQQAYEDLIQQFKERTVNKHYVAWVKGHIELDELELNYPIGRHPDIRHKMSVLPAHHPHAKPAKTIIRVLERQQTKTLIDAQLITGRTHQIRVHCAHIGHPVLQDPLYGPKKDRGHSQCLTAVSIEFTHPDTRIRWTVSIDPEGEGFLSEC